MTALPAMTIAFVVAAVPAAAQTIDDACLEGAKLYLRADDVEAGTIESFPELNPPRTNVEVDIIRDRPGDAIADLLGGSSGPIRETRGVFSCEFESSTPPFGLTKICPPEGCVFENPKRTEEIRVLLQRAEF